jgi:hypothetical protein
MTGIKDRQVRSPRVSRHGVAIMAVVVALAVLSVVLGAATWQIMAHRRTLVRHVNEAQALWLARAGMERAAARLLADPAAFAGETLELIPHSQLRISVQRDPGQADTFEVTSEARYPTDVPRPVVRSITRRFRRVVKGSGTRVVVVTGREAKQRSEP